MNISAVITAVIFLVVSVAALVFLFVGNLPFCRGKYRNFYRACCGVYISGVALVFVFTLIMKGLPVAYVLISDITVTVVFCLTVGLIYFMTRSIVETASKAENKDGTCKTKSSAFKGERHLLNLCFCSRLFTILKMKRNAMGVMTNGFKIYQQ